MALHPEELFIVVLLFPQKVIDCLVSAKETLVSIDRYSLSSISVRAPFLNSLSILLLLAMDGIRGEIKGSVGMATSLNSTLPMQNAVGESNRGVNGTQDVCSSANKDATLNEGASTVVAVGHSPLGVPDIVVEDEATTIATVLQNQAASTSSTTTGAGGGGGATASKEPKEEVSLTDGVNGRPATPDAATGGKASLLAADAPPQVTSTSIPTSEGGGGGVAAASKETKVEVHLNIDDSAPVRLVSASSVNSEQREPLSVGVSSSFEGKSSPRKDDSSPPPGGDIPLIREGGGADLKSVGLNGDHGLGDDADVECSPSLAEWLEQVCVYVHLDLLN